ncbi:sodium-independent sulfate anion transporter-like [Clavelina lepadiformis]|uniref:STAS domain-containing protein n=1 Tax=Clavelina lepadiformis TaxID=159417 RepID=A0ABP0F5Z5_CLALP
MDDKIVEEIEQSGVNNAPEYKLVSSASSSEKNHPQLSDNEVITLITSPIMPSEETIPPANNDENNERENEKSEQRKMPVVYQLRHGAEVASKKIGSGCTRYWSSTCSVDTVKQKLPIITWLPNYRLKTLKCDLIAGLTVGLTVIPQGMAYAALAGLELQYGLYSAFLGSFIYCLMGTSKDITMGPTAIMSILVHTYAADPWKVHEEGAENTTNVTLAVLLTFACGIVQLLMSLFKLGFLVRYISHPVITGFTSAAAIVIATTQLKKLFGLKAPKGFFPTIITIFRDIKQTKVFDITLGLCCMIVLFLLKFAKERWTKSKEGDKMYIKILRKILWFAGTGRNVIIVVVTASIAYAITDIEIPVEERPLTLTRNITGGLPPFRLPDFTYHNGNRTIEFPELLEALGSGLAVVPLMAFLESVAIAKAFGRKNRYKVDPSQELLTVGVSNFLSSFVSSYPITGSFGRSAVNAQSNVMTPMGGVFTGTVVLLALQFLSDAFQYIPSAALGAVIIMAVMNLFDFAAMRHIWHVNKLDVFPLAVTFFCCFWHIAYGIMIGIGVSLLVLLAAHVRPKAKTEKTGDITTIKIGRGLDYPGAEYIEDKLQDEADKGDCKIVILDCENVTNLDYSAAEAIYHGAEALHHVNISLKICGLMEKHEKMLKRQNVIKYHVKFYDDTEEAILDTIPSEEQV